MDFAAALGCKFEERSASFRFGVSFNVFVFKIVGAGSVFLLLGFSGFLVVPPGVQTVPLAPRSSRSEPDRPRIRA